MKESEFNPIETIRNKTKTLTFAVSAAVLSFLSSCEGVYKKEADFVPIHKRVELAEQKGGKFEKIDLTLLQSLKKEKVDAALDSDGTIRYRAPQSFGEQMREKGTELTLTNGNYPSVIQILPKQFEITNITENLSLETKTESGPTALSFSEYDFWLYERDYSTNPNEMMKEMYRPLVGKDFHNLFGVRQTDSVTYITVIIGEDPTRPLMPPSEGFRVPFTSFAIDNTSGAIVFVAEGEDKGPDREWKDRIIKGGIQFDRSFELYNDGTWHSHYQNLHEVRGAFDEGGFISQMSDWKEFINKRLFLAKMAIESKTKGGDEIPSISGF